MARDSGGTLSREVVPVADQLRTLADWLEAHPGANVSTIDLIGLLIGGPVRVNDFGARSVENMEERADEVGGVFQRVDTAGMFVLAQAIMPGFEFVISASKPETVAGVTDALACPVPDDESDVPF